TTTTLWTSEGRIAGDGSIEPTRRRSPQAPARSRNRPACDELGRPTVSEVDAASTPIVTGAAGGTQSAPLGGPPEPRPHGFGATTAGSRCRWRAFAVGLTWLR